MVTPFDSEGMKGELGLMTKETGAIVSFHTSITPVTVENGLVVFLTCLSCGTFGHAAETAVALALQNGVDMRYLPSAVLHKKPGLPRPILPRSAGTCPDQESFDSSP